MTEILKVGLLIFLIYLFVNAVEAALSIYIEKEER